MNPEDEFYQDMDRSAVLSVGMKRQGKTYLMIKFLMKAIKENKYDQYYLVLPQFEHERDGKYKFLSYFPNVHIFNAYHKLVSDKVLQAVQTSHVFFGIDDATSELLNNIDVSFSKLLTCNEHGKKCAIWLCVHSCKRILTPLVRQMVNYIFIYKNSNQMLLKTMWEEYYSVDFPNFKEFIDMYKDIVYKNQNEAFMYSFNGNHSFGIKHWKMMEETEPKPPKKKKKTTNNFQQIDTQKERIKQGVFQSLMRAQIKNEYTKPQKPEYSIKGFFNK